MRFNLKSWARCNTCWSVGQPNFLVGIHGAGYAMVPLYAGALEIGLVYSPLLSTGASSPCLPAALFC